MSSDSSYSTFTKKVRAIGHTVLFPSLSFIILLLITSPFSPLTNKSFAQTQSIVADTNLEHCKQLSGIANEYQYNGQYQAGYDAWRAYIESCAYLSNSHNSFSDVSVCNTGRNDDQHRFEEYREWLKKVLYYSSDTNYYCSDVAQILTTFGWFNDKRQRDIKGMLAVERYIVQSGKCPASNNYFAKDTVAKWTGCYQLWQDTASDPLATPFDSTLPTLEDLDLGILRGPISGVVAFNNAIIGPVISNLRASENPFTSETTIAFDCREAVSLQFEIYDILGRVIYNGGKKLYQEGENKILLPTDLPHGVLYARFATTDGAVKTIKLRKH